MIFMNIHLAAFESPDSKRRKDRRHGNLKLQACDPPTEILENGSLVANVPRRGMLAVCNAPLFCVGDMPEMQSI
jgi:hypothetical protein